MPHDRQLRLSACVFTQPPAQVVCPVGQVATQTHVKRTPELKFAADLVARSAERIEEILRTTPLVGPDDDAEPAVGEKPEEIE